MSSLSIDSLHEWTFLLGGIIIGMCLLTMYQEAIRFIRFRQHQRYMDQAMGKMREEIEEIFGDKK